MKFTAVTVIRNGTLRTALLRVGWNQAELARRSGSTPERISALACLIRKPNPEFMMRIQKAFGDAGQYVSVEELWPEDFKGFRKPVKFEQTRDLEMSQLGGFYEQQKALAEDSAHLQELTNCAEELLPLLKEPIRSVAGLLLKGYKQSEICSLLKLDRRRVQQIAESAGRSLRMSLEDDTNPEVTSRRAFIRELKRKLKRKVKVDWAQGKFPVERRPAA